MKLIRVFNQTLHKELWNWLAKYPWKNKKDWPGWERFSKQDYELCEKNHFCFACISADADPRRVCDACPLDWGETETCYEEDSTVVDEWGLFSKFRYANSEEDAARWAEKIANRPLYPDDTLITIVI